jgi:CHAT domain-containing protein
VIFIPDRTLEGLPFAALRDPGTGRFLIEERAVGVAPSAAFHLLAAEREQRLRGRAPTPALVLGVDDSGEGTGLKPLTRAEAEAQMVGRLYGVRPRLGPRATRQTFLAEAGDAEIVTFAGHAVANPTRPELSYLALAADGGGDGALYAREILEHRFPATRLVVLSACSTAGGLATDLAAGLPLAQTFLAAGVPVVTASLWPVDDQATERLMAAFHVFLAAGHGPVDALRRAQLELLHGSEDALRNPAAWAGFEVFGGATKYHPGS